MSEVATIVKQQDVAPVAVVQGETAAVLSMIERAARDPAVDVSKLERLFEMQQTMMAKRSETAFNAAMSAAQGEIEPVARAKVNDFGKWKYADLAAITEVAQPVIAKHGFGLSFGTGPASQPDHIKVVCDVSHRDGHTRRYETEFPYDLAGSQGKVNKTKIQAFGSTTTYGRRYMTLMIFNIATEDNDGNAPRGKKSSAESKRDGTSERFNQIKQWFENANSVEELGQLSRDLKEEINDMPDKWAALLSDAWDLRRDELKAKGA